jgi:hypothetical protein
MLQPTSVASFQLPIALAPFLGHALSIPLTTSSVPSDWPCSMVPAFLVLLVDLVHLVCLVENAKIGDLIHRNRVRVPCP